MNHSQSCESNGSERHDDDGDGQRRSASKRMVLGSVQQFSDDEGSVDKSVKRSVETLSDEEPASGSAGPHVPHDRPLVKRKRGNELRLEEIFSRVNKVASKKCKCHKAKPAQTPCSNDDDMTTMAIHITIAWPSSVQMLMSLTFCGNDYRSCASLTRIARLLDGK